MTVPIQQQFLLLPLLLVGCGDVAVTTTSAGGSSAVPEPVVVEPEVIVLPEG